ncbi:type VII secretion protein EccE [Antrihabitans cavernicola]|uniref:Type VII secretion protein EccE n=1 Tax=Antrihabitans cavernicola TaxID=2495913 RepID=A0A5A7S7M7_9NOCA|nr:type VII secretion protein EccE [Spelaeibacter cavernicola]KAA0021494.1 type VII secretion protein EccE [Spelaeibacter cavernicola]
MDRSGAGPGPLVGRISIANLVVAQLIGGIAGAIALISGLDVLPALGIAVVAALIGLIRIAKRSLLDWITTAWHYLTRKDYDLGQTVDYRSPSGRSLGLYWEQSRVVAVVEVLAPRGGLTRITREAFDSSHRLPMVELAQCLTQHDIKLSGIDIISHGYRTRAGTPAGGVYEQLIGPLPATAVRTVWIAISLDAATSEEAVARRGGETEGASRAVTVATQRIVRALDDAGCRSRILTAPEIREAVLQVTGGADPTALTQRWRHADVGENVSIGSAIDPNSLGSALLAKLWVAQSRGTSVAVRLRPGANPDSVKVGAAWRLASHTVPKRTRMSGMVSMNGRQRNGVLAHLPIAVGDLEDDIPIREFPIVDVDRLHLPSSGCGQLIGSDEQDQGIATRIVGSGISSVYLAGELYLAQQIVFRALAVGAKVLIRTDRPHAWENLVSSIALPERLFLAGEQHHSDSGYNAIIVDGVIAPPPHAGVTTIYLTSDPSSWPPAEPDVSIHQPGGMGNHVVLKTGTATVNLTVVSIPREAAFIGQPRGARAYQHQ